MNQAFFEGVTTFAFFFFALYFSVNATSATLSGRAARAMGDRLPERPWLGRENATPELTDS